MDVREYLAPEGESPFGAWFDYLDAQAAAKVTIALIRIGQGNLSNVKGVGSGVFEFKVDFVRATASILARTARRL